MFAPEWHRVGVGVCHAGNPAPAGQRQAAFTLFRWLFLLHATPGLAG